MARFMEIKSCINLDVPMITYYTASTHLARGLATSHIVVAQFATFTRSESTSLTHHKKSTCLMIDDHRHRNKMRLTLCHISS